MARVTHNPLLQGISGKIGSLVIRQVGGQTIVQSAESKAKRAPRSPKQQAHLDRMYQAQLYAKAQLRDPAAKALYATRIDQRRTSAYTVAIADYMRPPEILGLDARAYHGRPGDALLIQATDDFEVIAVILRFLSPTGTELETGPATLQPAGDWRYAVRQNHAAGTTCDVEAHDRPGNCTTRRFTL
jgi:hypothetical protein